ncbi:MAG: MerR family transcriptional regulator [Actinobacteria bacterium]|nr:MerR family transcriptional regulator [Actinomycetota bacterium]
MAEVEKKFGIGEVQNILKKEFPDVTISKIRFLEKEGLITPERTQSGYRKYTRTHIKQLSYVLRLQREEYLPLSVIKRKIQDLKSGKVIAGDLALMSGQDSEPSLTGEVPVSFDLAPAKVGLALESIEELVEYGVVKVREGPEGRYFSPADMRVLTIAKEFLKYGVEPRHLRIFTQFVTREAAFIEQIIRPQMQHKDPNAKRNALKELENLMGLTQMFTQTILREALAAYLPRPVPIDVTGEASSTESSQGIEVKGAPSAVSGQEEPAGSESAEMFPG